jgi:exodeoxyribonuclease VII small subunit
MTAKRETVSFEELYRRLEETVEKLERGGLPLEQSIALYEEGMQLAKRCQEILDKAELRVTKLRDSFTKAGLAGEAEEEEEEAVEVEDE